MKSQYFQYSRLEENSKVLDIIYEQELFLTFKIIVFAIILLAMTCGNLQLSLSIQGGLVWELSTVAHIGNPSNLEG